MCLTVPHATPIQQVEVGADAFALHDTYGFPIELTEEIARDQGVKVDRAGFDEAMEAQRERARIAGKFKAKVVGEMLNLVDKGEIFEICISHPKVLSAMRAGFGGHHDRAQIRLQLRLTVVRRGPSLDGPRTAQLSSVAL